MELRAADEIVRRLRVGGIRRQQQRRHRQSGKKQSCHGGYVVILQRNRKARWSSHRSASKPGSFTTDRSPSFLIDDMTGANGVGDLGEVSNGGNRIGVIHYQSGVKDLFDFAAR